MKIPSARNIFRLHFQIVFTVSSESADLSETEQGAVMEMVRASIRNQHCEVEAMETSPRWVSVILDADPIINIPQAASSLKAVLSRRINRMRGSSAKLWAPGYAAFSQGEPVSPAQISLRLEEK